MVDLNLNMPGNPRYQPKQMQPIWGYDLLYRPVGEVEIADLKTLAEIGVIPRTEFNLFTSEIEEALLAIRTTEVDGVERKVTKHDVRAWIRIAQEIVGDILAKWIHIPLTSYDPLDTARAIQFIRAYDQALKPSLYLFVVSFIKMVREHANTLQIGRTHGQHALPITVGFWFATILSRVIFCWQQIHYYRNGLVGKISGAVGAHNAQFGLGINELCGAKSFEERVLERLDLRPAIISTQILPPEPLAFFLFSICTLSAALGQFGRDFRNLMRTEIAEVSEPYAKAQVGSSTMPQKRNPITSENLEGTWIKTKNEFGKVFDTMISEHQRDLVNSSVYRDFPIIPINVQHQLNSLLREDEDGVPWILRTVIKQDNCTKNFKMSAGLIIAEPLYIALQMAGFSGDAHDLVNKTLMPIALSQKISLAKALDIYAQEDGEVQEAIKLIPENVWSLFHEPENYIGDAKELALKIANIAEEQAQVLNA